MSHKIKENMEKLQAELKKLCEEPITYRSAERIAVCHKAYKIMCEIYGHRDQERSRSWDPVEVHVFNSDTAPMEDHLIQMTEKVAREWTANMVNADGTRGPHWDMDKTKEFQRQYKIDCDSFIFYAVINSLYSDYCEALKKANASTLETYAWMAKAWIDDADAVPDKAAAYYTYVVRH